MAVFLRSFAVFSLVLQSSLAFAMEEKGWGISDEKERGKRVVRVAPLIVPSSFEVKQLLESAALTCITLQNIQYALIKFRYDLNLCENPQLQKPQEFHKRMELDLGGKRMDDSSYGSYLRERIQAD